MMFAEGLRGWRRALRGTRTVVPNALPILLLAGLVALGSLLPAPQATAQTSDLEAERLEKLAEQSFIDDDLVTATALYRRAYRQYRSRGEQVRILMAIAWLEHLQNRPADARQSLVSALVLEPELRFQPELYDSRFRKLFLDAQQLAESERRTLANQRIREGNEHLRARDYAAARTSFEQALVHRPDAVSALYNLALVDLYDDQEDAALAGFQKVLSLAQNQEVPTETRALSLINVGFLYNGQGSFREGAEALEHAVALKPDHAKAWSNLGVARRELDDAAGAAAAFRRAYELDPTDARSMENLALAAIDAADWSTAVSLLRDATQRYPTQAGLWYNLGLAELGLGQGTRAVEALRQAIAQDPSDRQGHASASAVQLARQAYESGDPRRAFSEAQRALAWRGDLINAWIYQGLAQRALNDLSGALASFERALQLEPTRADAHTNLGSIYFSMGRQAEARQAFERALAIDPGQAEARENLRRLGRGGTPVASVPSTRTPSANTTSPPVTTPPRSTPPRSTPPRSTAPPPSAPPPRSTPPPPPPTPGPRLGLEFADIDYSALGLQGVLIDRVQLDSPAARAGLAKNDLILKIDGRGISDVDDLRTYVAARPRGSVVVLDLLRGNVPRRVEVALR